MIRAVAIDDEPLALKVLTTFCRHCEDIQLLGTFTNTHTASEFIKDNTIDLLFIDIQMPSVLGTDFVRHLEVQPIVVFTTAFAEYAVEGFDLNAVDYLLKPFTEDRFEQCVAKVRDHLKIKAAANGDDETIAIKADYSVTRIKIADILYVEGYDDYLKFHLNERSPLVVRMTFKQLVSKLPEQRFLRIHKSYLINIRNVEKFSNTKILIAGKVLPVGASYKENLKGLI